MNSDQKNEELLREASAFGDEEGVRKLLDSGVNINSQHSVNGWTALHWAAKRGHTQLVTFLLSQSADAYLSSAYGETALSLASNDEIYSILSGHTNCKLKCKEKSALPITPNYLSNPVLAPKIEENGGNFSENWHSNSVGEKDSKRKLEEGHTNCKLQCKEKSALPITPNYLSNPVLASKIEKNGGNVSKNLHSNSVGMKDSKRKLEEEVVLKVRIADSCDQDFIEVEVSQSKMTYENVFQVCCDELNIKAEDVLKLRKLPNTVVRKDKDVLRFQNFQELELVLNSKSNEKI